MKNSLHAIITLILVACFATDINAQCADNLVANGGFEDGMTNWWNWHDNNPDAYSFTLDTMAYSGDSSAAINVLVGAGDLTSFQGGEYNNRPDEVPVTAGVPYQISFAVKSSVPDAMVSVWIKDENDSWFTLHNEFFTVGTEWQVVTSEFTSDVDRADVHMELKVYSENINEPYTVWFDDVFICDATPKTATCETNLLANPGFEGFPNGTAEWWTWHGGTAEAYAFYASDDAFYGDSSAVIDVLWPSDDITTGPAEYNNRGMVVPVVGGEFYEVNFAAKSTIDQTNIQVWIKDEFDSWITIHNTDMNITTEWDEYSFIFQADADRADIHMELKVFNAGFEPYQVFFDEVAICASNPSTVTCADNLVSNPGAEDGLTDWWTWHGGDETDYSFETSSESQVGESSLLVRVLKPTADITGTGEFNSRPQESPVVAEQNYKVSVWAKSTLDGAGIQMWIKDEFDGWTTIGNDEANVTTDWAEYSFIFANETDRDDIHLELKVFTDGATEPYDVWFDEISICETDEDPGSGEPMEEIFDFGALDTLIGCSTNLALDFSDVDMDNDGEGWEMWDGDGENTLSTWALDPVLPYSGGNSVRVDVPENHNVAELHHRFGERFNLLEGVEYTLTIWARSNVPDGDTVRVRARTVRDTDWKEPGFGNFMVTSNVWKNYSFTFTPEEDWNNAFVDLHARRWNEADFTEAYAVWYDNVQLCSSEDATVTIDGSVGIAELEELGVSINLAPNPIFASQPAELKISSEKRLKNTTIKVIDILGQTVEEIRTDIQTGTQRIEISTDDLVPGFFFVNIQYQDYIKTIKLQVVK
ncbi:MAG: carbohydrate binding domain-containing protein [Bacteroidota bacterium]